MFKFLQVLTFLAFTASGKIYIPEEIKANIPKDQQHLVFLRAIVDLVSNAYIKQFSEEEIVEKILYGLFNEFDVHTSYLDEETLAFLKEEILGKFGGLGLYIMPYEGFIKIMSCLDGGPAIGKLLPGDIITAIDGKFIFGMNTEKVTLLLKGKPNTNVNLKIIRKNSDPFEINLTRKIISIPYISTEIFDNIAYIKVSLFYENVANDIKKFLRKIKRIKGLKGIVIDLRLNPGGVLDEAVSVCELFLPKNTHVLSIKGRIKSEEIKTTNDAFLPKTPIVVLINAFSASASEIFAGALQFYKRAIIVGETSYGKGSVQQLIGISQQTAIKMTIAKYYLPNNTDIQAIGITPDIEVKTEYSDLINFREKDIARALKPDAYKEKNPITKESKKQESEKIKELEHKINTTAGGEKKKDKQKLLADEFILYKKLPLSVILKQDVQLAKAFEVLSNTVEKVKK